MAVSKKPTVGPKTVIAIYQGSAFNEALAAAEEKYGNSPAFIAVPDKCQLVAYWRRKMGAPHNR